MPKGQADLDFVVLQSVVGPIGQLAAEARYPAISSADGEELNALHDYTITTSATIAAGNGVLVGHAV